MTRNIIHCLKKIRKSIHISFGTFIEHQRIIMSDHVDIEFQTCFSNFLTIMFDTKEEVQQAYEIMKEGSETIYQMETALYRW